MSTNKLVLGTVQMGMLYGVNNKGQRVSHDESHVILEKAFQSGIRVLDTAEVYGDAHFVIGSFHRENPESIFEIITKVPSGLTVLGISERIAKYLVDLNVNHLEALLFHSFESYRQFKDEKVQLLALKNKGLFRYLGVSIYTNDEFEEVITDDLIDLIQLPFNLLDNVSERGDLLNKAHKEGKIIHTRSVFLQGLFFKEPSDGHPVVMELRGQLAQIHQLAKENGISISELAISYCLQQKNVDYVLIGVDSHEQLQANLVSAQYHLDEETMRRIDQIRIKDRKILNPALWK